MKISRTPPTIEEIQSLRVKDGDVIVATVVSNYNLDMVFNILRKYFPRDKNSIFITTKAIRIEQFSEEEMNAAGWYRK